jgi:hypothetical protein
MENTKKFFHEKCEYFSDPRIDLKYEDVLNMSLEQFDEWVAFFRKTAVSYWNETGAPPRVGADESEIIEKFSRLQTYKVNQFEEKNDDGEDIIYNFNKFATPVNQFFPAMYKTKIGAGSINSYRPSIYDIFANDDYLKEFQKQMKRLTRQDTMYRFSKTLESNNKEFHNSHITSGKEWILKWINGDKKEGYEFCLTQATSKIPSPPISADEVRELWESGLLEYKHISSLKSANWGDDMNSLCELEGKPIQIKIYPLGQHIFPEATAAFRIGMGTQYAVNFPPLTAKYLYQKYTNHIKTQDVINIYDPSAGWGGRLLGALSVDDRKLHYIGTDPNTENFIPELNKTRYEYLAEFFNTKIPGASNPFWGHQNTYDIYRLGSEVIHEDKKFQQYKGKLDMVFTSPPYFDRERYSDDDTQSFKKFPSYDVWKEGFLYQTLWTAVEYLRNDRYLLWNIADIKVGKKFFPLEQDSIDILESFGMQYKGKLKMTMSQMTGVDLSGVRNSMKIGGEYYKYEPIFVFYKP